jgi:hypothetical protein
MAPTYTIGDFWVTEVSMGREKYTTRISVVGEEADCWVLDMENPMLGTSIPQKAWVLKSDPIFSLVKMEASGTEANPFTMLKEVSLDFPDGPPWPLEVGKKFTMVTSMRQVTVMENTRNETTATSRDTYEVTKREKVKVPAGRFNCLKIVVFNDKGESYRTLWYSEEVKYAVKDIITAKSMSAQGRPTTVRVMEGKLKEYSS